jgi:protein-disulfide isomerase
VDAPVVLVEFSDFQCPYCKKFTDEIEPAIMRDFVSTGKVLFKYVPYSFLDDNSPGRESKNAAEAAYCAGDQGKFWEYHDMLFTNQGGENQAHSAKTA